MTRLDPWPEFLAAIDYLTDIARPDLTVTDALEEALRWWITEHLDPTDSDTPTAAVGLPWDDPDPLRTVLERVTTSVPSVGLPGGSQLANVIESAVRCWVVAMRNGVNDSADFSSNRVR